MGHGNQKPLSRHFDITSLDFEANTTDSPVKFLGFIRIST